LTEVFRFSFVILEWFWSNRINLVKSRLYNMSFITLLNIM
jgi:hypothetical protein